MDMMECPRVIGGSDYDDDHDDDDEDEDDRQMITMISLCCY